MFKHSLDTRQIQAKQAQESRRLPSVGMEIVECIGVKGARLSYEHEPSDHLFHARTNVPSNPRTRQLLTTPNSSPMQPRPPHLCMTRRWKMAVCPPMFMSLFSRRRYHRSQRSPPFRTFRTCRH